ncbi:hypothetical protein BDV95DRAFT_539280 [Massariosphaeria phaeospora]|uniref:Uncharacterized protein n=1 Tax=Massariosphaeria phaeospora TaxID=100035 RepID=A0A7C8ID44_9PLEO|nr:hypothetical protein BDV95DRAFT_539280 [Massariosphaeria phaeospora]
MTGATTHTLEKMVLQAHRAKGIRYPAASNQDCHKTWYSYALRRKEAEKTTLNVKEERPKTVGEIKEIAPGGRTYLEGWMW